MQQVACEQRERNDQQSEDLAHAQGMFPEYFQHVGQQGDPGTEEDEPNDIERVGVLFAIVRQMEIDHQQTEDADRDIHEKDEPPVKVSDDEATRDGSQHGANQAWNGDEAHGADELGFGKCAHQGQPAHRHHHGSAAALQDAAGHQQVNVGGDAAEK